jgi:hypothetical protein
MENEMKLIVAIEQAISNYRLQTGLVVQSINVDNSHPDESAVTFKVKGSLDTILTVR